MMKIKKTWLGMLVLVFGMVIVACVPYDGSTDENGDDTLPTLPPSSGTNEVLGKTLYLDSDQEIYFADSGTTFHFYVRGDSFSRKGSYSYNGEDKTIILGVEQILSDGGKWLNKTQAKNEAGKQFDADIASLPDGEISLMLAAMGYKNLAEARADRISYVGEMFELTTYDYQFTDDGSLLVQEKLPANQGSNELQGKNFSEDLGYNNDVINYTFATNSTYTSTYTGTDSHLWTQNGTYAYNSSTKRVWLRPEKIRDKTMIEYYSSISSDTRWKALDTNRTFRVKGEKYRLNPNRIGYHLGY